MQEHNIRQGSTFTGVSTFHVFTICDSESTSFVAYLCRSQILIHVIIVKQTSIEANCVEPPKSLKFENSRLF
jgi:hypothetical protein